MSSGSLALPATPTPAVENWRFLRLFPFFPLNSRLGAILVPPSKYLSSPPCSWIRMPVSVELFYWGEIRLVEFTSLCVSYKKIQSLWDPCSYRNIEMETLSFEAQNFQDPKFFFFHLFLISKSKIQTISLLKSQHAV